MEFETIVTRTRHTITVSDGTEILVEDWGAGQPIVFSHGWPLNADAWEDQMVFLGQYGDRCIAHDRRGHGRSSQPSCPHGHSALCRASCRHAGGLGPSSARN
jgi:pimeloyl-ACP methyl ester carboxylesterase